MRFVEVNESKKERMIEKRKKERKKKERKKGKRKKERKKKGKKERKKKERKKKNNKIEIFMLNFLDCKDYKTLGVTTQVSWLVMHLNKIEFG